MRATPITLALAIAVSPAVAGCSSSGGVPGEAPTSPAGGATAPAPRAELAARAAAAQDLVGVGFYALETPRREEERTVMVVRAADGSWRVDVPGGALGGTADVSVTHTGEGLFQCRLAPPPGAAECVAVDELAAAVDPRVHHVFTDWLDVLTDRSAPLAISAAPPLPGAGGECFAVEPSAASLVAPLDGGVYCYRADGTLTAARLGFGTLTLVGSDGTAPGSVDLPGPVVDRDPLPTASPTPSPGAAPTPSPGTSPTAPPGTSPTSTAGDTAGR